MPRHPSFPGMISFGDVDLRTAYKNRNLNNYLAYLPRPLRSYVIGHGQPASAAMQGKAQAGLTPMQALMMQMQNGELSPTGPLGELLKQYQAKFEEANQANLQRYQDILSGYDQRYAEGMNLANAARDQQYKHELAAVNQDLVRRGLRASTLAGTGAHNAFERAQQIPLNVHLANSRDKLDFMERRTDEAPSIDQMINLAQMAGQQANQQQAMMGQLGLLQQLLNQQQQMAGQYPQGGGDRGFGGYGDGPRVVPTGPVRGDSLYTNPVFAYSTGMIGGPRAQPIRRDKPVNITIKGDGRRQSTATNPISLAGLSDLFGQAASGGLQGFGGWLARAAGAPGAAFSDLLNMIPNVPSGQQQAAQQPHWSAPIGNAIAQGLGGLGEVLARRQGLNQSPVSLTEGRRDPQQLPPDFVQGARQAASRRTGGGLRTQDARDRSWFRRNLPLQTALETAGLRVEDLPTKAPSGVNPGVASGVWRYMIQKGGGKGARFEGSLKDMPAAKIEDIFFNDAEFARWMGAPRYNPATGTTPVFYNSIYEIVRNWMRSRGQGTQYNYRPSMADVKRVFFTDPDFDRWWKQHYHSQFRS